MGLIDADELWKQMAELHEKRAEEANMTGDRVVCVTWHDAVVLLKNAPTVDIDAITESHENIGYDRGFRDGYAQASSEEKHGHWIAHAMSIKDVPTEACSECGEWSYGYNEPYCPNCGAKMEAETK